MDPILTNDEGRLSASRLTRDLAEAARMLTPDEARFLVDAYYLIQKDRIRADNQLRALSESGEPASVLSWLGEQSRVLETQVKRALDKYSDAQPVGLWARGIVGVGPVIAAGLLAHIDISRCPTVGHIWAFAGLDPTREWGKGERRPWNADLKTLCWKLGESFVKVSAHENDIYGKVYAARKAQEIERNERGDFADQAAAALTAKRYKKDTDAFKHYTAGLLPPAHIHARAKRYAVKLFLAHLHDVWYQEHFGTAPPKPYMIEHLGHTHFIPPPRTESQSGREHHEDRASHPR